MIGKTDPEGLDERIDALCKFNLSNRDAFGYGECMNNTKKVWEAEMMLEISKQRRFFESMNRESI